jgi:2-polyprenyl-3-methyl-5-hydroxy-6-metoxy-1,4-benzoquinol methylase
MTIKPTNQQGPTRDDVHARWEAKAGFWDERMGDGNVFHRHLVGPVTERLLAVQAGERILDVSCGNGTLSRELARRGATVVATDFSETFIARANVRAAEAGLSDSIAYHIVDSLDEDALVSIGEGQFDGITCTMAVQDMPAIAPLFRAAHRLLRPGGRFVVVMPHPSFNQTQALALVEQEDRDVELVTIAAVKVRAYLSPHTTLGVGMPGEPNPHYYFHRSLQETLNTGFAAGLILDGIEEAGFPDDGSEPALSWLARPEFPAILGCRFRRLAA